MLCVLQTAWSSEVQVEIGASRTDSQHSTLLFLYRIYFSSLAREAQLCRLNTHGCAEETFPAVCACVCFGPCAEVCLSDTVISQITICDCSDDETSHRCVRLCHKPDLRAVRLGFSLFAHFAMRELCKVQTNAGKSAWTCQRSELWNVS